MYCYGGTTQKGPSSELWAYNIPVQSWGQVRASSPAPFEGPPRDFGWGTGAVIGRHLYSYAQLVDPVSGEPVPGGGQLWRWAPSATGGGGAPPAPATATLSAGATTAVVFGLLLGVGNLALLVLVARANSALPDVAGISDLLLGCGGSKRPSSSAAGFYSSAFTSSSGKAEDGGSAGYVAPP